jgi:hypothetical protein
VRHPRARIVLALALAMAVTALGGGCGGGDRDGGDGSVREVTGHLEALSSSEQRALAARVEGLVRLAPAVLGYRLQWGSPRPGTRAEADLRHRVITIYARRGDAPHRVAHDLAHELGHAYDHQRMTEASRRDFLARRGRPDAAWWPAPGQHGYTTGAEDFAEVFALCQAASPEFRSRLAPRPDAACAVLPAGAAGDLEGGTS